MISHRVMPAVRRRGDLGRGGRSRSCGRSAAGAGLLAHEASIAAWSFGSAVKRSGASIRSARWAGSGGARRSPPATASGNFAGWAVASATIGVAGSCASACAPPARRPPCADRAGSRPRSRSRADLVGDVGLVERAGVELAADRRQRPRRDLEAAGLAERLPSCRRTRRGVATVRLEQQPLEIRRDLDVHRGRGRRHDAAHLVDAGLERARQNVVLVGARSPGARSAGPCAWRHSPRARRRNCRSAPRRRPCGCGAPSATAAVK